MNNKEIEKVLREIGIYLEMKDIPFKPRAFERVADTINELNEEVNNIYKNGGIKAVKKIPGVGESIAGIIEELIKKGKSKDYQRLQKEIPVKLSEFEFIEGVGPKTIKTLYKKLKIKNLKELERATKSGKIRKLPGFGVKSELNILKSIDFLKKSGGRFIRAYILNQIKEIELGLNKLRETNKVIIAGSTRRKKETIGDVDILVTSKNPKKVMDYFVNISGVLKIIAHGDTKSSIKLWT